MTTVVLSNIPDLTMSVSVPRLVAIERPFGQQAGKPGDKDGQMAALLGALEAVEEMTIPGSIKRLPLEWNGTATEAPRSASNSEILDAAPLAIAETTVTGCSARVFFKKGVNHANVMCQTRWSTTDNGILCPCCERMRSGSAMKGWLTGKRFYGAATARRYNSSFAYT